MSAESDIWTATMHNIALIVSNKVLCNISKSVPSSNLRDTGAAIKINVGYILHGRRFRRRGHWRYSCAIKFKG